jgi:protein AroM
MTAVGAILLGQAPDRDLERALRRQLGPGVEIVQKGPFDGDSLDEIRCLAPRDEADAVTTALPDGTLVIVSRAEVSRRAPSLVEALRRDGVQVALMACTTDWPDLERYTGLVLPGRLSVAVAAALMPPRGGTLGVFLPVAERISSQVTPWLRDTWEVAVEALPPAAGDDEVRAAAATFGRRAPSLVVLDCLTYTERTRALVAATVGVPTLLPLSLAAGVMRELIA